MEVTPWPDDGACDPAVALLTATRTVATTTTVASAIATRDFRTKSGYFSGAHAARTVTEAPVTKATRCGVSSGARLRLPRPRRPPPSPARGGTRRSPAPSRPPRPGGAGTRYATRPSPLRRDGRSGPPTRGGRGSGRRGCRTWLHQLFQQEVLGCTKLPGGVRCRSRERQSPVGYGAGMRRKVVASLGLGRHAQLLELTRPSFERYADRHGYELSVPTTDPAPERRHKHWAKIALINRLLPECDLLLWVDADAAIVDSSVDIEEAMPEPSRLGL